MAVISSSSRLIFIAISFFCLIIAVACRPQSTIDSQVDSSDQDNLDIRRLYNYPGANSFSPEERIALNRLQYEMMANYVQNGMAGMNMNNMNTWSDPVYRSPEIKRQVRYRQCYFNPISCFRK